ncbi:hypothetical protein diail_1932 [Diaporthe ilicicola]|nr:hypothetical protein diail_1932 [Diaporthe ilicicola]
MEATKDNTDTVITDTVISKPCKVCGYSKDTHSPTHYNSSVKIAEVYVYDGDWRLGSRHFLRERRLGAAAFEPLIHALLQSKTTIPVPKILASWREPRGTVMTIEERADGESLAKAWPRLSETERDNIAQQAADYIKQLRGLQSHQLEGVDGTPVYSDWLFGSLHKPTGPFDTKEDLWVAMAGPLRGRGIPDKVIDVLGRSMPSPEPYTFTHGTLHISQFIIKDMKIVGITEWTLSAYMPCWFEYAMSRFVFHVDSEKTDEEWKAILRPKLEMENYEPAVQWFSKLKTLERYPNLPDQGAHILKELEDEAEHLESKLTKVEIK